MAAKKEKACPAATGQACHDGTDANSATTVYHDESERIKRENEKDQELSRLIMENNKLKKNQVVHCIGCRNLVSGDIFYHCKRLGVVNPWEDYCSKREPGGKMMPRPKGV